MYQRYNYPVSHHVQQPVTGYEYGPMTGADYLPMTGTNGLAVVPQGSPMPVTGNETIDKIKVWMEKPVVATSPNFKNWHASLIGVAAVGGLAWYGHSQRWF